MPSAEQQYGLGVAREFNGASDSASFAQAFRNESTLQTYGQFNADWRNVQQYAFQNSNLSALGFPDGSNFSLSGVETPQSGAQYLDFTNAATGQTVAVDQLGDVYNQQTGALEMPSPFLSQPVADAVPQNYETATNQDLSNLQAVLQGDAGQQQQQPPPPETPPPNESGQQSCPANGEQSSTPQDSGQQGCPDDSGQQTNPDDSGQQTNPDDSGQQTNPDDSGQQTNPDNSGQQGEGSDSGQQGDNSPNSPGLSPDGAQASPPPDSSPPPTAQESNVHQVAAGETLWSIAQQDLGGDPSQAAIAERVQQLAKDNQIADPNKISVGQIINLDSAAPDAAHVPTPIVAPISTQPVAAVIPALPKHK